MTTRTDLAQGATEKSPVSAPTPSSLPSPDEPPLVTLDELSITAEPGSSTAPSFYLRQHGSAFSGWDFAVVTEGLGIELRSEAGPLRSALRCRVRASVRPLPGYRITEVSGSVTSGIAGGAHDPTQASAAIRTRTTLDGVALPSTSNTTPGVNDPDLIPAVLLPAPSPCPGEPLTLDILIEVDVHRVDEHADVRAWMESYDLRFELAPCP